MKGARHSFDRFEVKGVALREFEDQIASLVTYLHRSYGVKFESIVCDFNKDELGNVFMTNCKGFKVYEFEKIERVAGMSAEE